LRTLTVVALLFAVLVAPLAAEKKKPFPDSATGRALNAFFEVMESGDEGEIRTFIDTHFDPEFRDYFPLDEHVAQLRSLHEELGMLHAMSVDKPNRFTAILEVRPTESDERYRIRIDLNPNPPHGIVGLGVEPVAPDEIPELTQDVVDENAVVADHVQMPQVPVGIPGSYPFESPATNMVNNKYCRPRGLCQAKSSGHGSIANNECGIPAQQLAKIFDPGFTTKGSVWVLSWVCPLL